MRFDMLLDGVAQVRHSAIDLYLCDRSLESLLSRPETLAPKTALFVAAARLQGYRPQPIPLANALVPLLETHDGEVATAAAALRASAGRAY